MWHVVVRNVWCIFGGAQTYSSGWRSSPPLAEGGGPSVRAGFMGSGYAGHAASPGVFPKSAQRINHHDETDLDEMLVPAATALEQEIEQGAQTAGGRSARKTLEDQLAEIRAQEKKVLERIKQGDKQLRAQYEKDLWALLREVGMRRRSKSGARQPNAALTARA